MKIENPVAFKYLFQDEIFLLENEKSGFTIVEDVLPEIDNSALTFKYLGNNKINFLVLVHYPNIEYMAEMHLTALENTVKRLSYDINDFAIFNLFHYPNLEYQQILDYFSPKKILVLGKLATIGPLEKMSLNKIYKSKDRTVLYTFSFDEMMESNENKKIFWEQMKQL